MTMAFGNFGDAMKLMGAWNKFRQNHPKFPAFLKAVSDRGFKENMVFEVIVTEPDGEKIETSIKINAEDLELFSELKAMSQK